jgi:excisionase family DNA binding protein
MIEILTPDQLCEFLNIKKSTLYSRVERREIPFFRIGRLLRFRRADIDRWLDSLKAEPLEARPQPDAERPAPGPSMASPIAPRADPPLRKVRTHGIVERAIAEARRLVYTSGHGKPEQTRGRKGG